MCFCIGIIFVSWTIETKDLDTEHWIWSGIIGIILFMVTSCCFYICFKWGSSIQHNKTKVGVNGQYYKNGTAIRTQSIGFPMGEAIGQPGANSVATAALENWAIRNPKQYDRT